MKKVLAGIMAAAMVLGTAALSQLTQNLFSGNSIFANAATDAWGREYLTYGDFHYQIRSDNTIAIIGFDVNKSEVDIPDEIDGLPVTRIGNYAFYDGGKITTIKIPDTVTYIGEYAFYHCKLLESVILPEGLTEIGRYAFDTCESLKTIDLPSSLTTINEYAFTYSGLESVEVPESVTTIKRNAFFNCTMLKTAKLPSNLEKMGQQVFAFCWNLEEVVLPESLTSLPDRTFFKCNSLKTVTIPEGVTSIGKYAFYYCASLEEITIPENVETIDESAFEGCSSLKTVEISEGVTTFGKYIFKDCALLESFVFPKSVTSAGNFCFAGCTALEMKVYEGSYGEEYVDGKQYKYNQMEHIVICTSGSEIFKYQFAKGTDDEYSVRYVFNLDEEFIAGVEAAEFYLTGDDFETDPISINNAYKSIYAAGKLVTAEEGKVFVICTFRGVPKSMDKLTVHFSFDDKHYEGTSCYSDSYFNA